MKKLEQLRRNTEKAYQSALKAMFELVDAITEERNYYRDLCNEKKDRGLHDQFGEEYDKFINLKNKSNKHETIRQSISEKC